MSKMIDPNEPSYTFEISKPIEPIELLDNFEPVTDQEDNREIYIDGEMIEDKRIRHLILKLLDGSTNLMVENGELRRELDE